MVSTAFLQRVSLLPGTAALRDQYPLSLPAVRALDGLELHPRVTFFVGENGSGKSTILEALAIAVGFNPEGGGRNLRFDTRATHSLLHEHLRLTKGPQRWRDGYFLRAETFYNVATAIEELDAVPADAPPVAAAYGGPLHERSHGEAFLALLLNRFGGQGLYLLDEPEAALSPQRQLAVLARLHQLVQAGSQFVIATHSPLLMAYPDAIIYLCSPDGLTPVAYEDTEHYQITRDFLAHPQRMLRVLLAD